MGRMLWPGTRVRCLWSTASWALVQWLHFLDFHQKTHKGGEKKKKRNHPQWYLSVTTVNSHLFSLPTLLSPPVPSSLVPMCSILAGTKLCYGNKWLGRDVSMGGPPFLICLSLEQLPSQMGRASITLLSGTWRSPKQSRAPVVMWDCFPKFKSPKWQPTPVFLLGEPYGQRSLAGYSPQNLSQLTESQSVDWSNFTLTLKNLSPQGVVLVLGLCVSLSSEK